MVQKALSDSRRNKAELLKKLREANRELATRIKSEGMEIEYSHQDDYLRITIGSPRTSVGLSLQGEIYSVALIDPDTGLLNALEAPFFLERHGNAADSGGFWQVVAGLIKSGRTTVYIPAERDLERAGQALQDLVPA